MQLGLAGQAIGLPQVVHEEHVFNQYVIRAGNRDSLKRFLSDNGIGTEIYYPCPMHLQDCLKGDTYRKGDFPESEAAAESALALPIYPELSQAEVDHVISKIENFYSGSGSERVPDEMKVAVMHG